MKKAIGGIVLVSMLCISMSGITTSMGLPLKFEKVEDISINTNINEKFA